MKYSLLSNVRLEQKCLSEWENIPAYYKEIFSINLGLENCFDYAIRLALKYETRAEMFI